MNEPTPITAPYGSWQSPITSDLIVANVIGLGQLQPSSRQPGTVYWVEARPNEAGRIVIVRRDMNGQTADLLPAPFYARTRVHEYGGKSYWLVGQGDTETVYFANFADQRLYKIEGELPVPVTPESDGLLRYADLVQDTARQRLIAVREDHRQSNGQSSLVVNTLVSLALDGSEQEGQVLVNGSDFYSSPALSPDGRWLAWLSWNHPNMPWDGTELWLAEIGPEGTLGQPQLVAGGPEESVYQPAWSPEGQLHFISDRSGWWNLYRREASGESTALCPRQAEFGLPQWQLGYNTYTFTSQGELICTYEEESRVKLARLVNGELEAIPVPYTVIGTPKFAGQNLYFVAGDVTKPIELAGLNFSTGQIEVLQRSAVLTLNPRYFSAPRLITFPTGSDKSQVAYALYYPPTNPDFQAPAGEKPPLLVKSHGGPTAAASGNLNLEIQFWTSRGFAVADVDYGGSTGYGRAYRERLKGRWGIVDREDCTNAARYLVEQGLADPRRLAIDGGSAGGYTTLCVLTFEDYFRAGASYFGVSDLEALAQDTHKFESRYLDKLVGDYPARRDIYVERSPIHFTERLNCPLILFQGLEDPVVPPNQAVKMFEAVRAKGLPVAYLPFEGEQHGFRQAANIKRSLDAELYFYSRVFGFALAQADQSAKPPVEIENLA